MSQTVIKVENLGKLYRLGEVGTGTISHDLNRWWARVRGKEDPFAKIGQVNDRATKGSSDYVWALKDVNFEVKQGEVLGIIGRNGAGKSTLLKILSKVTAPTTGSIKVKGRIASLLEVGTGFHPELTGRENIYLNGAILGMTRNEIRSKFDEIVDFAGVERYIDTPVKRYSSGMYVRLAFAVAAFLEPEILIVDEVLAVGDAEFQKKCLGRMKDVSVNEGRTVLFVSHNMDAVRSLCKSCIVLQHGRISFSEITTNAIDFYVHNAFNGNTSSKWSGDANEGKGLHLVAAEINCLGRTSMGSDYNLKLTFNHSTPHKACFIAVDIYDNYGCSLMQCLPQIEPFLSFKEKQSTTINILMAIPPLVPGVYYLSLWAGPHNNETFLNVKECLQIEVVVTPTTGRTFPHTNDHGFIVPYSRVIADV